MRYTHIIGYVSHPHLVRRNKQCEAMIAPWPATQSWWISSGCCLDCISLSLFGVSVIMYCVPAQRSLFFLQVDIDSSTVPKGYKWFLIFVNNMARGAHLSVLQMCTQQWTGPQCAIDMLGVLWAVLNQNSIAHTLFQVDGLLRPGPHIHSGGRFAGLPN